MHVQQGDRETSQLMMRYGMRPVQWLLDIGYLDDQLIAVHLTGADEEEAETVANTGVLVGDVCQCRRSKSEIYA